MGVDRIIGKEGEALRVTGTGYLMTSLENLEMLFDFIAPKTFAAITNNSRNPIQIRVYNTSTTPAASPTFSIGQITVQNLNAPYNKSYQDKLIGFGRGS